MKNGGEPDEARRPGRPRKLRASQPASPLKDQEMPGEAEDEQVVAAVGTFRVI